MPKAHCRLSEGTHAKLRQAAVRQRRSMADCIREGINSFLQKSESRAADIAAIAGKFAPKPMSGLKRHDRWWAEAIMEKWRRSPR